MGGGGRGGGWLGAIASLGIIDNFLPIAGRLSSPQSGGGVEGGWRVLEGREGGGG